jgi:hypothetical protein
MAGNARGRMPPRVRPISLEAGWDGGYWRNVFGVAMIRRRLYTAHQAHTLPMALS